MSLLVGIDTILDLISDVKEVDQLVYSGPVRGLITVQLWCEDVLHSEVLMRVEDFNQAQVILTGTLIITFAE